MKQRILDNLKNLELVGNTMGSEEQQNVTIICDNEDFFKTGDTHAEFFKHGNFRVGIYNAKHYNTESALDTTVKHADIICKRMSEVKPEPEIETEIKKLTTSSVTHPAILISLLMLTGMKKQDAKQHIELVG